MTTPARYAGAKYEQVPAPIREAFEKITTTRKGIYIHGPVGTGKTHLAYALKGHWDTDRRRAQFWNVTELIREIKLDFDRDNASKVRPDEHILESKGLLFLDDLGAEKISDFVAETIYLIVNHRYNSMLPIVVTSNLPLSELADRVGDRVASRITEMCDVFELGGADRRLSTTED